MIFSLDVPFSKRYIKNIRGQRPTDKESRHTMISLATLAIVSQVSGGILAALAPLAIVAWIKVS